MSTHKSPLAVDLADPMFCAVSRGGRDDALHPAALSSGCLDGKESDGPRKALLSPAARTSPAGKDGGKGLKRVQSVDQVDLGMFSAGMGTRLSGSVSSSLAAVSQRTATSAFGSQEMTSLPSRSFDAVGNCLKASDVAGNSRGPMASDSAPSARAWTATQQSIRARTHSDPSRSALHDSQPSPQARRDDGGICPVCGVAVPPGRRVDHESSDFHCMNAWRLDRGKDPLDREDFDVLARSIYIRTKLEGSPARAKATLESLESDARTAGLSHPPPVRSQRYLRTLWPFYSEYKGLYWDYIVQHERENDMVAANKGARLYRDWLKEIWSIMSVVNALLTSTSITPFTTAVDRNDRSYVEWPDLYHPSLYGAFWTATLTLSVAATFSSCLMMGYVLTYEPTVRGMREFYERNMTWRVTLPIAFTVAAAVTFVIAALYTALIRWHWAAVGVGLGVLLVSGGLITSQVLADFAAKDRRSGADLRRQCCTCCFACD